MMIELKCGLVIYGMREVCYAGRPMLGTREYIVRAVLGMLAGDVQHAMYNFDFGKLHGKLSDENEEEIHAVCEAAF